MLADVKVIQGAKITPGIKICAILLNLGL